MTKKRVKKMLIGIGVERNTAEFISRMRLIDEDGIVTGGEKRMLTNAEKCSLFMNAKKYATADEPTGET